MTELSRAEQNCTTGVMPDGHGLAGWAGGLAWSGAGAGLGRALIGGWPIRRWRPSVAQQIRAVTREVASRGFESRRGLFLLTPGEHCTQVRNYLLIPAVVRSNSRYVNAIVLQTGPHSGSTQPAASLSTRGRFA